MAETSPVTYLHPDDRRSPFRFHDSGFSAVLGDSPRLVRVVDIDAHEGPVYCADEDALYFTTLPRPDASTGGRRVAIKRLALDGLRFPLEHERVTVVRTDANAANGMTLGRDDLLIVCEQGGPGEHGGITKFDRGTGAVETVVDELRGLRFNSPNDVVVKSDGSIWFTDPSYGYLQGFKPEPQVGDYVYRYEPSSGRLIVVADSFDKPNGIAFSPDEGVLYVTDSGANQEEGSFHPDRPHHIVAFDVHDRRLFNKRLFAVTTPGFPDGIKTDSHGRVYASCFSGVQVFDPSGELIGEIELEGAVNFTFGGPDRNVLFITTDDAIWAAILNAEGLPTPHRDERSVTRWH
jgi:gluconolactonase